MKICRNCHVLNDDDAGTCWNCSGDLSDSPRYIPVMLYPNPIKSSERESVLFLSVVSLIVLVFLVPVILGGFVTSGQMYAYDIEPNNGFGSAVTVPACEGSLKGFVNEYMDSKDFYSISFQSSVYELNLSLSFEDRNIFNITAFDSALNPLGGPRYSNHSGEMQMVGLDIQLNGTSDPVIVRVIAEKGGGEYMLRFMASPPQCGEYGDDAIDPQDITGEGRSFSSAIPASDSRYSVQMDQVRSPVTIYSLSLAPGQFLRCDISGSSGMDINATLYDSFKSPLVSALFVGDSGTLEHASQDNGTFFLVVRDFRGSGAVFLDFNISSNPMFDGNNELRDAEPVDSGDRVFADVDRRYDAVDYFGVNMVRGENISVKLIPVSPVYLSVLDDQGGELRRMEVVGSTEIYLNPDDSGYRYLKITPVGTDGNCSISLTEVSAGISHFIEISAEDPFSTVYEGDTLHLTAELPDNATAEVSWSFGDGGTATGVRVNHTFPVSGTYIIRAVRADNGEADTYTVSVKEHRKMAVIVGISDYIQSSVEDLNYCHTDALNWASYLRPRGYEMTVLLNDSATKDRIISSILSLEAGTDRGDMVVFIFSGHGFEQDGRHFIVPADTMSFSTGNDISDLLLRAVTMTSRSQHRFVYLDSCHSGGMNEVADNSTLFIAASRGSELSVDSGEFSSGLWTHYFLQIGLEDDGYAALEDAFNAVSSPYTLDADRNYGVSCHPVMIDGDPAENFVL